jgi:hypothetical protein
MAEDRTYTYDVFSRLTDRRPRADDLPFVPGHGSYLPGNPAERNFRLLRGYKRAGDLLIQAALAGQHDQNSLVFPAIFSYRHYIELALKALVEDHGSYAAVLLGPKNHKLTDLWKLFVKIATAFGYDCSDASDLRGSTPALPNYEIDLLSLHDVMNGMENFFECVDLDFTQTAELAAKTE